MPLEHASSRFGFQDNRSYGKSSDIVGVNNRLKKYKTGKAHSVIRSYFFWLDVMSRQDRKAWIKRGAQIRAMIINSHGNPGNYIRNQDKSGMMNVIFMELDREEARYLMSGSKRKSPDGVRSVIMRRKRY